jgi:hypothetical protein
MFPGRRWKSPGFSHSNKNILVVKFTVYLIGRSNFPVTGYNKCMIFESVHNLTLVVRTYMWENFNNSFNMITHTKICIQKIISLQFTVNCSLKNRVILFHTGDKALEHIQEMHLQKNELLKFSHIYVLNTMA